MLIDYAALSTTFGTLFFVVVCLKKSKKTCIAECLGATYDTQRPESEYHMVLSALDFDLQICVSVWKNKKQLKQW